MAVSAKSSTVADRPIAALRYNGTNTSIVTAAHALLLPAR